MRVAIDSGGTFTDCVSLVDGALHMRKVLSTPQYPSAAILAVLSQSTGPQLTSLRHGTTVGTNALLERKGARVAFVTTAGFEDTLAIGRQARASLYDWFHTPPPCLIPPNLRFGIDERTAPDGVILRAPTTAQLDQLCARIAQSGAQSIALSLLFSFANPANEEQVAAALAQLNLPLSVSSRILPEFREYERASTLAVNAYLAPIVGAYLRSLSHSVAQTYPKANLHIMQSSGGILPATLAAEEPVRTVLSGPAGGVIGACRVAQLAGFTKIITFDMGGTSTDVSLIDATAGTPETTNEAVLAGLPIAVPMLDIHTVGAGGGSIARYDSGGILHVGPESAGASPGPICYGAGALPTVTDANLLLGRLDPANFLGGSMPLDLNRTRDLTTPYLTAHQSLDELAAGILLLAEASMEQAIRLISIERGHDPRDFTLVSFGGAGPLHAAALARSLSIPRVLVPPMPGALSALGILLADQVRDYSQTVMTPYDPTTLTTHFEALEHRAQHDLQHQPAQITRTLDLRYQGQGYELQIPASPDPLPHFHQAHRKRYGYSDPTRPVEVVNIRIRATAPAPAIDLPSTPLTPGNGSHAIAQHRPVSFHGRLHPTPIYARAQLRPGDTFPGPALVTEYSTTTVVSPGDQVTIDTYANLIIEVAQP